jgi:hypothetical protein
MELTVQWFFSKQDWYLQGDVTGNKGVKQVALASARADSQPNNLSKTY